MLKLRYNSNTLVNVFLHSKHSTEYILKNKSDHLQGLCILSCYVNNPDISGGQ